MLESRLFVRAVALGLLISLAGCSLFEPQPEPVEEPTVPDPEADRLPAIDTARFDISDGQTLFGESQVLFSRYEDTFSDIAREYNVGFEELKAANPGIDPWLPGEATPVFLPTHFIVPDAPREGIVLNLPSMRLFHFSADLDQPKLVTHPIGIGRSGWETPVGSTEVTDKARDPVWYVPASVRAEHEEMGDPLPAIVQPGPDNPLGRFVLKLGMPGYLIHGTNQPYGVGMRVSHGCVRLYPENIEVLFGQIPIGTPVHIVDQPVLAAWGDGVLLLEVHPPLEEDQRDVAELAAAAIKKVMDQVGQPLSTIDQELVAQVIEERRGLPLPVTRFGPTPTRHLASVRVVENTAPITTAENAPPSE